MTFSGKYIAIISLFAFIAVGLFGIYYSAGMGMNDKGEMSGCIFSGKAALCKMNIAEHMGLWQNMLTAILQKAAAFVFLLLVISLLIITALPRLLPDSKFNNPQKFPAFQHYYLPIFDQLKEAFSKGILHPKVYEPAVF